MKTEELRSIYQVSPGVVKLNQLLQGDDSLRIKINGLSGSSDALISTLAIDQLNNHNHLFILNDREEANYFNNDLESLTEEKPLLFPISYKRPYHYVEVDNANILQRTEVLNDVNEDRKVGSIIVTYPEALCEKVINKRSLVKHSFNLKVGEKVDLSFISELLIEYGFEKTDFVYEPGNFSLRGGIIDVFSFAHDMPVRIELFGSEVESIRSFEPDTQLSVDQKKQFSIVPNLQTKLLQAKRESLLEYLPKNTIIWIKDAEQAQLVVQKSLEKAETDFDAIREASGDSNLVSKATELFITESEFRESLEARRVIEFGSKQLWKDSTPLDFAFKPQMSFNKDFKRFIAHANELKAEGYQVILASESVRQINKLKLLLEELDATLEVQEIYKDLRSGFLDHDEKIAVYTDHQLLERFHKFKTKERYSKSKALTLRELKTLSPGDFVTHIDHGIGRFAGMEIQEVNDKKQEMIRIIYRDDDLLYVSLHSLHKIAKYSGQDGKPPSISKLGSPEWENKKKKVKRKVKEIAINLIALYAKRKQALGFAFQPDTYLQAELESSFIYEDTPDQAKATSDVKADMEMAHPMDRLVCGDVGFGKTEVAIRAAFKAVADSKQVAVLVPTTILAMQHYKTFKERLRKLPANITYLNRFRTAKEVKEAKQAVAEGKVDILIGTHMLVGKNVKFKDLGLLIIDEEQKFGVAVKEKLKDLRHNIDVLTLTATPIPRTLQFSLMGARDLSIIATPPTNRQGVHTEIHTFNEEQIRDAIRYELKRGGQVFFVHNRINDIDSIGNIILKLIPDARIGVAHGQIDGKVLERTMVKFIEHEYDVLVSTNIIESGLDIPNANTIIINQSHMYGLSDLHQMRGRVGRSNKKAFCYLLTPSMSVLTSDSRKRLQALEEFSDLGDGFKISMRDLDIRGAGNLLGGEQSGFINDIGFETYQKLLEEAVKELKETEFKDLFSNDDITTLLKTDCNIETELEVLIPEEYVTNISERLRLYNELDIIPDEEELHKFQQMLVDRFGPLPEPVQTLCKTVRLRWEAEKLGFHKLRLKESSMKAYVPVKNNDDYFQSDTFGRLLTYIQSHPRKCSFKELKGQMVLTFLDIKGIDFAIEKLQQIQPEFVN